MKKKTKRVLRIILVVILAIIVVSCAVFAYFFPVGLYVHSLKVRTDEIVEAEVIFDDTIHFKNNGQHIVFKAELNGKPDSLIYDTGDNSIITLMYTPSTRPEEMKFYRVRVTGVEKKSSVKITTLYAKVGTEKIYNTEIGQAVLFPERPLCENYTISDHHLLGLESLNIGHEFLDFTNSEIRFVNYKEPIDTTGFVPVKCTYEQRVLWVYPQINGVEYKCIFDTGNGRAGFVLKGEQRVENPKTDDFVYEGSYGTGINGQTNKQRFVDAPKERFSIAEADKETDIIYVKNLPHNNMGLKAISQFDWIISMVSDPPKVYAKPHVNNEVKPFHAVRYKLIVDNGKLKILTRLIDGSETFKVGDRIVSVNGEKITEENICHYYDLLSESDDWSGFDIKVK